jgi:FixJ family two-component response regulator
MFRVGIVDDDASHCRAVARLLRASGMEVLTFSSAEEYLGRGNGPPIECLVLDIQLGGMSGFELQSGLAAVGSAPPVVFLTAHEEPETIARARRTGCAYVRKTDPASVLLDAIRRAIAVPSQPGGTP